MKKSPLSKTKGQLVEAAEEIWRHCLMAAKRKNHGAAKCIHTFQGAATSLCGFLTLKTKHAHSILFCC